MASSTPDTSAVSTRPVPTAQDSFRETLESITIAFILAFAFRAFVVEAFVIPTGSMAPTLLGEHVQVTCPSCGYDFTVGADAGQVRTSGRSITCPMCGHPVPLAHARRSAGDRILVLKYLYAMSEPVRWDVVVFKHVEEPTKNFIKRLVGLPGERLRIIRGNVYTQPLDEARAAWRIQAKPDYVQQAVWQPIYHSNYIPQMPNAMNTQQWRSPWRPIGNNADAWSDGHGGPVARQFHYDAPAASSIGMLSFDFQRYSPDDRSAYNQLRENTPPRVRQQFFLLDEFRISGYVTARQALADDASVTLAIDGHQYRITAELQADGAAMLRAMPRTTDRPDDPTRPADAAPQDPLGQKLEMDGAFDGLTPNRAVHVELVHVDHQAVLHINGKQVLAISYADQVDAEQLANLPLPVEQPQVRWELSGGSYMLESLRIDRDLYYTPGTETGQTAARATAHSPVTLKDDEFFCLGDNSAQSSDSRAWSTVDPWVQHYMQDRYTYESRAGQQEPGLQYGVVPRELMIGRAFFVYWPAMYAWQRDGFALVPNFAEMRFIE